MANPLPLDSTAAPLGNTRSRSDAKKVNISNPDSYEAATMVEGKGRVTRSAVSPRRGGDFRAPSLMSPPFLRLILLSLLLTPPSLARPPPATTGSNHDPWWRGLLEVLEEALGQIRSRELMQVEIGSSRFWLAIEKKDLAISGMRMLCCAVICPSFCLTKKTVGEHHALVKELTSICELRTRCR